MNTRGSTGIWGFIIVLTLVSAVLGWWRLSGLPELEMLLGPDLTVRHVAVEGSPTTDGQPFQRGDVLRAVSASGGWHTVDDLRELRTVLPAVMAEAKPPELNGVDGEVSDDEVGVDDDVVVLDYQLFRPVHRFSLALQGEVIDPTELPPGVQPEDRLVEVDGRLLPDKMGPEGIRSMAASRPDAVLGFERPDAVFFGQLKMDRSSPTPGVLLVFLLVIGVIAGLWRWHSDAVGARSGYYIAVETLALGWLLMLVFGFQWVLADEVLASGVVIGLVMMRPLAIFAREQTGLDRERGGLIALGIGALAASILIGLMVGGTLQNPEWTLHAAAMVAGLFIIYELAASGMEGDSLLSLGERGGYLAGVVVLGLSASVVAMVMEPVAFQEDRWRWFAVLILSLMWFGDVLYAVKYGARSAMGEIADRRSRSKLLRRYLREMALEMPHTDLRLVGKIDGASMQLTLEMNDLRASPVDAALGDAVDILINEGARVPLPEGTDRNSHPMAGIAQAMNISLAVVLTAPEGSLALGEHRMDVALVGMRESTDGDIPSYASSETLDRAQEMWTGPVASAAKVEMLSGLFGEGGSEVAVKSPPAGLRRQLKEAKEAAVECQEERASLVEERDTLRAELEVERHHQRLWQLASRPQYPVMDEEDELLEPELVEGLEFLLETAEPVVLGGRVGVGKGFVAHRAHDLDGGVPEDFVFVDMSDRDAGRRLDEILGEEGGGTGQGLLEQFDGGLLVRGAEKCDDGRILALCHHCEETGVRLYLSFASAQAERESVLEDRPATLQDLLGHREVVIPRFAQRTGIQASVLNFWLREWTKRYEKDVDGFSRLAMEVLESYPYPGQIAEAVEIVRLAVVSADHDVVDCEDLPLRVQQQKRQGSI